MRWLQPTAAGNQAEMISAKMPCEIEDGSTLSFHAVIHTQLHSAPSQHSEVLAVTQETPPNCASDW